MNKSAAQTAFTAGVYCSFAVSFGNLESEWLDNFRNHGSRYHFHVFKQMLISDKHVGPPGDVEISFPIAQFAVKTFTTIRADAFSGAPSNVPMAGSASSRNTAVNASVFSSVRTSQLNNAE